MSRMENRIDFKLMKRILECEACRKFKYVNLKKYPPICCFGEPLGKKAFVIGINPSRREYEPKEYVKKDRKYALKSQLQYFKKKPYGFFDEIARFFNDSEIGEKFGAGTVWDRVAILDLVKCVTIVGKDEQWNGLKTSEKNTIIGNCQHFLIEQLSPYRPELIIAYGKDVGMWFKSNKDPTYEEEFNFIANPRKLAFSYQLIYVPQRQGKHSRPEVNEVKAKIKEAILRARLRGGLND
jgi:hypothetical protein